MRSVWLLGLFAVTVGGALPAQEVPRAAVRELLAAARSRLNHSSNGWALVEVRQGSVTGDRPDTVDVPVTHDWNYVYAVCNGCSDPAGISMDLHDPEGTNVSNGYATFPARVVWALAEAVGTFRAVIHGTGCHAACRYTIGVFQERRGQRRGSVWDARERNGGP